MPILLFPFKQAWKSRSNSQNQMFSYCQSTILNLNTGTLATPADGIIPQLRKYGGWETLSLSIKKGRN